MKSSTCEPHKETNHCSGGKGSLKTLIVTYENVPPEVFKGNRHVADSQASAKVLAAEPPENTLVVTLQVTYPDQFLSLLSCQILLLSF